jgi:hypothetical protein
VAKAASELLAAVARSGRRQRLGWLSGVYHGVVGQWAENLVVWVGGKLYLQLTHTIVWRTKEKTQKLRKSKSRCVLRGIGITKIFLRQFFFFFFSETKNKLKDKEIHRTIRL